MAKGFIRQQISTKLKILFQYKDAYTREYTDSSLSMAGGCIIFGLVFTCFSLLIPSLRMVVKAAHHYVKEQEEK